MCRARSVDRAWRRTGAIICAGAVLFGTKPAYADRIGTIGDWETWTDAFGKPYAIVNIPVVKAYGASSLSMQCGDAGKIKFGIGFHNDFPNKLILDNPNLDEFEIKDEGGTRAVSGSDAERLLKVLLQEEAAARTAGAKSWTLVFFIDDPQKRGYSANIGGVKDVRDHLLKWCAAPAGALLQAAKANGPKPQSDGYLTSQPFLGPDRRLMLQFYESGMYQVKDIREARGNTLKWQGSYTISSNALVLDPNTKDAMTCAFQYTPRKDFVLSKCPYAGVWVAMQNVR